MNYKLTELENYIKGVLQALLFAVTLMAIRTFFKVIALIILQY